MSLLRPRVRLGKIAGIEVGLHYSWFVVPVLVAWSLAVELLPDQYPGWTSAAYWGTGVLVGLMLSVSVLAHEMAHSLVARRRGIPPGEITLFLLGGVSSIEGVAQRARDEFVVAIAGPVASLLLAALVWALLLVLGAGDSPVDAVAAYAVRINVLLAAFNILPAFPLDGGRVLRSALWALTGSRMLATRVATLGGQLFGVGMIAFGVFVLVNSYPLGGVLLGFLGLFLHRVATRTRAEEANEMEAVALPPDDLPKPNRPDWTEPRAR